MAEPLWLWRSRTGHPFCSSQGQPSPPVFLLSLSPLFTLFFFCLRCFTSFLFLSQVFCFQLGPPCSASQFCFPGDARSFPRIPPLGPLPLVSWPPFPLCFLQVPKAAACFLQLPSSLCVCGWVCTPRNLSGFPSLPFIFLARLCGCSLGLSPLLLP